MLDHPKMLQEIDDLANNDFTFKMEWIKNDRPRPFTQEEAEQMADLLNRIRVVSHCIHCAFCQKKYRLPKGKV